MLDVGGKIKISAKVYFWITSISCVLTGFILLGDSSIWWVGLIILVLGVLVSWLSFLLLYAFGELVENVEILANKNGSGFKSAKTGAEYSTYETLKSKDREFEEKKKQLDEWRNSGLIMEEEYQDKIKELQENT